MVMKIRMTNLICDDLLLMICKDLDDCYYTDDEKGFPGSVVRRRLLGDGDVVNRFTPVLH